MPFRYKQKIRVATDNIPNSPQNVENKLWNIDDSFLLASGIV